MFGGGGKTPDVDPVMTAPGDTWEAGATPEPPPAADCAPVGEAKFVAMFPADPSNEDCCA